MAASSDSSARARASTEGIIARVNDLEQELRKVITGDVRFDPASRLLYATDASMYQVEPIGVVIPRDNDDVQAAVEVAKARQVALLPRGGGTSLTGQTVNRALVLDFSRHMHGILEVNAEELWARVQPGLVQDNLNHHVRPRGLLFGPDTSTPRRRPGSTWRGSSSARRARSSLSSRPRSASCGARGRPRSTSSTTGTCRRRSSPRRRSSRPARTPSS